MGLNCVSDFTGGLILRKTCQSLPDNVAKIVRHPLAKGNGGLL
jgi:hypothetical protein